MTGVLKGVTVHPVPLVLFHFKERKNHSQSLSYNKNGHELPSAKLVFAQSQLPEAKRLSHP